MLNVNNRSVSERIGLPLVGGRRSRLRWYRYRGVRGISKPDSTVQHLLRRAGLHQRRHLPSRGRLFVGTITALLILGRLSDHLGRRPTSLATLALLVAGCVLLSNVHDIGWLIGGRLLMGLGAGLASSALTSYIVDAAPAAPVWVASVASSQAPMLGLTLVGTISRELRRNAATRGGKPVYRAVVAQGKAQQAAKRPKTAKSASDARLREYVQDPLAGNVRRLTARSSRAPGHRRGKG